MEEQSVRKPLLLSPAGSYDSLCAAVSAGADEVYFGAGAFNARAYAKGFTEGELADGIRLCRLHGVAVNITLNTLVNDREIPDAVNLAYRLCEQGADTFIVEDLGLAARLKSEIPEIVLHASTQCACHSADGAKALAGLGFSRIVLARELPYEDIRIITECGRTGEVRYETETFVHGALCVCHSGMCLMSSCIGGRSGNRGECAQPCRLPGKVNPCGTKCSPSGKDGYPLSLKDLTLAGHIRELCESGTASLKIEGRMKSPEYVYRVTSVWRRLLDLGENAGVDDIEALESIFSRGGFTDGYFTEEVRRNNKTMYGVRSESDKARTKNESFDIPPVPKIKVRLECTVKVGERARLCAEACGKKIEVLSESEVQAAKNAPMTEETLRKNLVKCGGTDFDCEKCICNIEGEVFMPSSAVNALRRDALSALSEKITEHPVPKRTECERLPRQRRRKNFEPKHRLYIHNGRKSRQISDILAEYEGTLPVESIVLPLSAFADGTLDLASVGVKIGVSLPRVIFDEEKDGLMKALYNAKKSGAVFAEVSNIGHITLAKEARLEAVGGVGLNVYNSDTASVLASLGLSEITLSPELSLPQMRDLEVPQEVKTCVFAKGRLPLMVLESCIVRCGDGIKCRGAAKDGGLPCGVYRDRIGKEFPVYGEPRFTGGTLSLPCRNIILNSVETDLLCKSALADVGADTVTVDLR